MSKVLSDKNKIILSELIYPLFINQRSGPPEEIVSMPGVYRYSLESLGEQMDNLLNLGLSQVLLFGVPKNKTWLAQEARLSDSFLCKAIRYIRSHFPEIKVFTDICLCAYTSHGHCGIINRGQQVIDQKKTLIALSSMALACADAGANYVAPSAMTLGQVQAIRNILDKNKHQDTKIMAYSAKFASSFYGPFREVADSAPRFSDRRNYQLNFKEETAAFRRIEAEIKEGADIVMVKPALGYLDIVKQVKTKFNHPLAVYNVSGEYAMIKQGVKVGLWDEKEAVFEIMGGFKRAGADFIISYYAKDVARWQRQYL